MQRDAVFEFFVFQCASARTRSCQLLFQMKSDLWRSLLRCVSSSLLLPITGL